MLVLFLLWIVLWLAYAVGREAWLLISGGLLANYRQLVRDQPFGAAFVLCILLFAAVLIYAIFLKIRKRLSRCVGGAASFSGAGKASMAGIQTAAGSSTSIFSDTPILCVEEDLLERMPFIKALYYRLLLSQTRSNVMAQYVGVLGRWGEGKTSVRNLLKKFYAKHPLVSDQIWHPLYCCSLFWSKYGKRFDESDFL